MDLIILPDAGHAATIWIGLLYLSIVGVAIAMREWVVSRNTATAWEQKMFSFLTFAIAYFSGSLHFLLSVYMLFVVLRLRFRGRYFLYYLCVYL